MGQSISDETLTEDMLEEYKQLTYLSRAEIVSLHKIFLQFGREEMKSNFHHRFPIDVIKEHFPQLKYNPLRYQIYKVFSSEGDMHLSFEDMLDLASVMSENCSTKVKAVWAFRIFDTNADEVIDKGDLSFVLDRLTQGIDQERILDDEAKEKIINTLLMGMDLQGSGAIGPLEFEHAVSKLLDFRQTFSFRI